MLIKEGKTHNPLCSAVNRRQMTAKVMNKLDDV